MKKIFTLLLTFLSLQIFAQDKYVVRLANKNNSPFSFSNPSAYLSSRAIQRRTNQNIPIDSADLPVNPAYISGISGTGAAILGRTKWLNAVIIQTSSSSVLNAISNLPYVVNVNNVGRHAGGNNIPYNKFSNELLRTDEMYNGNANRTASFDYGPSLNQIQMIGGDLMHDNGFTGTGIHIAVIDAGFENADNMDAFDSLFANNQVLGTRDFVDNETNVYDNSSHGSMVLSIIGGNWPGNIVGTAPHAKFWLLRSEDAATEYLIEEYNWAEAAEFADSVGADVINSSLGYTEFDDPAHNHTYNDMDGNTAPSTRAADFAAKKGMIVCNSAGNSGNDPWNFIGAPADADSILAIGAVDDLENYASFSSNGPTSDGRVKPDV
ncbi:MAG: S8 family serine peptidase, partial [Bacteroidia bacterium]